MNHPPPPASPHAETGGADLLGKLLLTEHGKEFESLLSGIVHAFNNTLVSIQGANDLAIAQVPADSPVRRELDAVHASVSAAKEIVGQLIVFSSGGSLAPAPAHLPATLESLLRVLRVLVPDRIALTLRCDPGLPPATVDDLSFKRLITNLVKNAKEAIRDTGTIAIRVQSVTPAPDLLARHGIRRDGPWVAVRVTDDGSGIEPADLPRIFDPFFSRKRGGLGLGLSAAFVTAHRHDGFLTAESAPGRGTTVTLYLPAEAHAALAPARPADAAPALATLKGAGERILIVEDEGEVLRFVARALGRYGFDVTMAGTLAEADALFEREKGRFHLLFSDVSLPDGNGFELARRFRAASPSLAILMTSGFTGFFPEQTGEFPILRKPYGVTDLLSAIRAALTPSGA